MTRKLGSLLTLIVAHLCFAAAVHAQIGQGLVPPFPIGDDVGYGQAVAVDGNYGFVGAQFYDSGNGVVFVYEWDGSQWMFSDSLKASDQPAFEGFGSRLEADNGVLAVAAPFGNTGAVYVFRETGGQWIEEAKLTSPEVDASSDYSEYIDVSDNLILVGAADHTDNVTEMGRVYVYEYDGSTWAEIQKISLANPVAQESFGEGVEVDGDVALIRARNPDRVFIFRRSAGIFAFEDEFSDPAIAFYGEGMAVQDDVIVIGGPGANLERGTALVYRHDGLSWQFEQELNPSFENENSDGNFGAKVSLSGQLVAVSAPASEKNGVRSGLTFVFEENGGVWTEIALLEAPDADEFHQFGASLDLSGSSVLVSSADIDAAYAFEVDCTQLVGKRRVECECVAEEWTYTAGDFGVLSDASSWDVGTAPNENSLMVFPLADTSYTVIPEGGKTGAMFVEADLDMAASGSGIPTFGSPCGESIVVQGRAEAVDPGSSLNLIGATIAVDGNIVVPGNPGTIGELNLVGSRLESSESILVDLGGLDAAVGFIVDEGSAWVTPLAAIDVGEGSLFVSDRSSLNTRILAVEDALVTLSDSSSIIADSVYSAADIFISTQAAIYATSISLAGDSTVRLVASETALIETGTLLLASADSAMVVIDSTSTLAVTEALDLGGQTDGYAEIRINGELTDDEGTSLTTIGATGEALLDIESGGHASLGLVFLGSTAGGAGNLEIDGTEEDTSSTFRANYLAIGERGNGFVSVRDALFDVHLPEGSGVRGRVELGTAPTGDGTLQLLRKSLATIDVLTIGTPGRGDIQVRDTSILVADIIVLGDSVSTGGFGSMTVDSTSGVAASEMCVGCIDGVGILGVEGTVTTEILQVGPLGTIRGNVTRVQMPSANKTVRPDSFSVITTRALYLSEGATVDIDSLFVEDGTLGGTYTWPTDFTNIGTISPGDSARGVGTFTIDSTFVQTSSGTYLAELAGTAAGTEHDVLAVSGDATIDGILKVEPVAGFIPNVGDRFRVLTATSVTGTFAAVVSDALGVMPIYEADGVLVEIVSTVDVERSPVAREFRLAPNYPNPFSDKTRIAFTLEQASEVQLELYDLFGRRVAVLVDGMKQPGQTTIEVDGLSLASGTYLYRLKAGTNSATRTLTIIR